MQACVLARQTARHMPFCVTCERLSCGALSCLTPAVPAHLPQCLRGPEASKGTPGQRSAAKALAAGLRELADQIEKESQVGCGQV